MIRKTYRGKPIQKDYCKNKDGFVYGSLYIDNNDKYYIIISTDSTIINNKLCGTAIEIDPETLGEFTGLSDKNGMMIYTGDIIKTCRNHIGKVMFGEFWDDEDEVEFYGYAWVGKDELNSTFALALNKIWDGHSIIGDIYNNPELLK